MRLLTLLLALSLPISAHAASYQQIDGTIVDPIRSTFGGVHHYIGPNLEPGANLSQFEDLSFANLSSANLHGADLAHLILTGADLANAIMYEANLREADLSGADLSDAFFFNANLSDADLNSAILTGADMANAIMWGVKSGDISGPPLALPPDWLLIDGYLVGPGADLIGEDLSGANFSGLKLINTYLLDANLSGANLTGADLSFGDLFNANLAGADFTGADLNTADLVRATYDEFTIFPNGNTYLNPSTGLLNNARPWELRMIPTPEPTAGLALTVGGLAVAVAGRRR